MKHASAGWLVWAAPLVVLPFLGKAPALDEETYLFIGANASWLRPYDWARAWPPYDADAFVFAHPPLHLLWMKLWSWLAGSLAAMRAAVGLPWVALLGWSVGRLADRSVRHPSFAAAAWLASATVALGLTDTLMIDLPATALATFAVAAYREAVEGPRERAWGWAAGVAMGLALATKYSMAVLLPVLALHMLRRDRWRWEVAIPALAIPLLVEAWLLAEYGKVHAWEVWTRRGEIASGPIGGRLVGTIVRAGLLPLTIPLFLTNPKTAAAGLAVAVLTVGVVRPEGLSGGQAALLVVLAGLGGAGIARAVQAAIQSPHRRRKGDRGEPLLLGGWILAGVLGVVLLHNYASARYLLPVAAPLAILLARSAEEVKYGKALLGGSVAISAALAIALSAADHRYAAATVDVARRVAAEAEGPGRFAGEWGFRWGMERAGWARHRPDEVLPAGTIVAVADNASPGAVPVDAWEPVGRVEAPATFPVRVVDVRHGVGLYAETLGAAPFGLGKGPLEGATLYEVR